MTPVTKYWVCKIGAGAGRRGDGVPRRQRLRRGGAAGRALYREVPVNAIWEGSGNVMALDVLRVLQREPETVEIVMEDLAGRGRRRAPQGAPGARAGDAARAAAARPARPRPGRGAGAAGGRHHPARARAAAVADAFIATRLSGAARQTYGQGLDWADTRAIVDRAFPG